MSRYRRSTRRIVLQGADEQDLTQVLRPTGDVRPILETGEFLACDLLPWGSNYTYVAVLGRAGEPECLGIYKPRNGEAPLWDFPDGTLYQREVAAYRFAQVLDWDLVPETIIREGPKGIGSLQLYIDPVEDDYQRMREKAPGDFRRMCLFDYVSNNADRKSIHCLQGHDGRVWGIDHGLTFHPQTKLRTVIWDFAGEAIPTDLAADLRRLVTDTELQCRLEEELGPLLEAIEIETTLVRAERILKHGQFPEIRGHRQVPYGWW